MLEKIKELAVSAGKIMLEASDIENYMSEKSSNSDVVTVYDVRVQSFLFENLKKLCPDAYFFGEEGEHDDNLKERLRGKAFIIDPIDGTTNFVRDLRKSCVSIAYLEGGDVVLACVYNPYTDELYTAKRGEGAYLGDKRIISPKRSIPHSLVAFGSCPYDKESCADGTFEIAKELAWRCMDVRRMGSCVLDILDCACGRVDIFFELRVSPWDFAAGYLIAREAGLSVSRMNGMDMDFSRRCSILVASKENADFVLGLECVKKYFDIV